MKQTQQERWAAMTLPQRQKEYRTSVVLVMVCLILLFGFAVYRAYVYVTAARLATEYHATIADAREVRMEVTDEEQYYHSKGPNDYLMVLKDPNGTEHNVYVLSRALWQMVGVRDTVTAQVWQDKVREVRTGHTTSVTSTNPDYALVKARRLALTMAAAWVFYTGMGLLSLRNIKKRMAQVPNAERIY